MQSRAIAAGMLLAGMCVSAGSATSGSAQEPRQPVGAIVNPSAELLGSDGRPAHWILEPRAQPGTAPGAEVASGRAWFDDLTLELITTRELRPDIVIQADTTREPMPDLIYGQFIEHLGKSIYGGIWAEMLEDRKFYSAVGETRRDREHVPSPWRSVGAPGVVTMVTQGAFVGAHTPQVDLGTGAEPRGIAQSGLGVVAGKGYAGYVFLAGDAPAAPIDVRMIWGDGPNGRSSV